MNNSRDDFYIMGIQSFASHDSGAALIRCARSTGSVDFVAISEERLIRKKYPYTFPVHSIAYCLDYFGLSQAHDIDVVVTDYIRVKRWFNSGPSYNNSEYDYLKLKFDFSPQKMVTIDHHLAHAASVYYTSGFHDAAILVVDGNGSDLQTTSFFRGNGNEIQPLDRHCAQGIGAVYSAVTKWILNLGTGGEGKTMGLAPFGEKHPPVLDLKGRFDGVKNDFSEFIRRMPYSDVLNHLAEPDRICPLKQPFNTCKSKEDLLDPYFSRVAYEVQSETERTMVHLGNALYEQCPSPNLCVSGGVALNSVANKIMFDQSPFEKIHLFPACSDAGIPFGLAAWGYHNCKELADVDRQPISFRNAYTGKAYERAVVEDIIERHQIPHRRVDSAEVARLISEGNIVGWFQGRSEYGPRALGHRSILADSRREDMKDIVNVRVKHRETFRPFAPAVLAEHSHEYFDLDGESPFMLLVANAKRKEEIPSVIHVDGTARVQTVTKKENGSFYDLIAEFKKLTGVSVILNTSFNDAGEPIVETPEDAIICFANTGMDYLVIEDFLFTASEVDRETLVKCLSEERRARIRKEYESCLERLFPGYNLEECQRFINEQNKIAEWHVKYRSKCELENRCVEWQESGKRVLLIGTRDHTAVLLDYVNGFRSLNIIGFVDFEGKGEIGAISMNLDSAYPEVSFEDIKETNPDIIVISSHEYMYDILETLRNMNMGEKAYSIYDNSSRSFVDVLPKYCLPYPR